MKRLLIAILMVALVAGTAVADEQQTEEVTTQTTENDWSAGKVIGTVIAVPLVPVILVFEGVTWTIGKIVTPNNAASWGSVIGDVVRR